MKPQIHVCYRCGKEMAYRDKFMLYLYKCVKRGELDAKKRLNLCEACARRVMGVVIKYCSMEQGADGK